jgi:glycosyltransferase involved in cell wall biosynthesis
MGYINPKSRTGIFRVTQETLLALLDRPDLSVQLVNLSDKSGIWDEVAAQLYLESLGLNLEDHFIHSFPKLWLATLRIPVKLQKSLIHQTYQSLPLLYKAGIAMQIPIDRGTKVFQPPFKASPDVYHSSFLPLPKALESSSITRILTVHDLIPIKYPEFCTPKTNARFQRILNSIHPQKDWITCVSEATKRDLCNYLQIDPERVFVVPLAAASHFHPVTNPDTLSHTLHPHGLQPQRYLLSLATIEPRKNLELLIRSFIRLHQEQPDFDLKLALVGPNGWRNSGIFAAAMASPAIADKIVFTGYLPDRDLSAIYSGALGFVYPSIYEGFGLPPLEAMQCGTPVITSNVSSLPEVVGDTGLLIDPYSQDDLCQAILRLVRDSDLRQALSARGLSRSQQFSWANYGASLAEIYYSVAGVRSAHP